MQGGNVINLISGVIAILLNLGLFLAIEGSISAGTLIASCCGAVLGVSTTAAASHWRRRTQAARAGMLGNDDGSLPHQQAPNEFPR